MHGASKGKRKSKSESKSKNKVFILILTLIAREIIGVNELYESTENNIIITKK